MRDFQNVLNAPGFPSFNPMMILHGEEVCEIYKPIVPGVTYEIQMTIKDV
jgi:hypothetical protein